MPIPINTSSLFSLIDSAGVFAGAMGGALEAKQNRAYQFDFVGVIGLGFISALGGGITRDVLLQHGPRGTRYINGGVRSADNADLASGYANVMVL